MHTDTLETEVADDQNGEPDTLPIHEVHYVDVGATDDQMLADPDHLEVARAEAEGMTAIVQPAPSVAELHEEGLRLVIDLKMKELFAERAEGRRLEAAEEDAADRHKKAKKARETQDETIKECIDALEALDRDEPDPDKYPLLDKRSQVPGKPEINAAFPAPEAIQPLPAADFDEYLRRKQNGTPIGDMRLKKATIKTLVSLGLDTAGAIVRKFNSVHEAGLRLLTITGMTEAKLEEIAKALDEIGEQAADEWDAAHAETFHPGEAPYGEV